MLHKNPLQKDTTYALYGQYRDYCFFFFSRGGGGGGCLKQNIPCTGNIGIIVLFLGVLTHIVDNLSPKTLARENYYFLLLVVPCKFWWVQIWFRRGASHPPPHAPHGIPPIPLPFQPHLPPPFCVVVVGFGLRAGVGFGVSGSRHPFFHVGVRF